jgi:general secretion pathway protein H
MPISAIGSDTNICIRPVTHRGFTLLEIMLVLLIVAVTAALVVPRMFHNPLEQLENESRRLQKSLQLAEQEATLTGYPIRWSGYPDRYTFQEADEKGVWRAKNDGKVFAPHHLAQGVHIGEVRTEELDQALRFTGKSPKENEEPSLGRIVILPDGMLTITDIVLVTEGGGETIHVRPGPKGISREALKR